MNVVFIGASQFGLRCLKRILEMPEINVTGIVTNPKTFSISYRPTGVTNVLHADVSSVAADAGIPVVLMEGKMSDPCLVSRIESWKPDFILVVGWYHMVPKAIRTLAPTAGLHASLLPNYSGGAPLVWAIINGEKETGISFFLFDDAVDSGAIIGQRRQPIYFEDTIATLYSRIEIDGISLLEEHLPKIANGGAIFHSQNENERRIFPQRSPEDGIIDWNRDALSIYNFIRAQTRPYPGAFSYLQNEKITIWRARAQKNCVETGKHLPGTICGRYEDTGILVHCGDGHDCLIIDEVSIGEQILSGVALQEHLTKHGISDASFTNNAMTSNCAMASQI